MKRASSGHQVCLVTAPDLKTARRLARAVLLQKVAACANLVPGLESHYWWQGKLEKSREVLIVFKTTRARYPALEAIIRENHPYDTPEIIALPIDSGYERYLSWISSSVQ